MKPIFALATCLLLGGPARAEKAPQLVLENLDGSTFYTYLFTAAHKALL